MSRLDAEMVKRCIVKSRNAAQQIIKEEKVFVNGSMISKASFSVNDEDSIVIKGPLPKYVGRGGLKLEKAVNEFNISLSDKICIDIGASTGGFTDCMLQNGAKLVYAVDVGKNQLDISLRNDKRVISLEETDVREAEGIISEKADFISVDVSFISLKLVLPEVKKLLKKDGQAVALIKPQFEVGKSGLGKHGVVKSDTLRNKAVNEIKDFAEQIGFAVQGLTQSPITGGDGNIEFLIYLFN
ncbi:MAG: TlyA family RNA methyltransferase [Firmicutes bacterium]|nr:TlyA family RNA methyltransferase [[Eubacterium] siraeum]MCM1487380.1 TlyA family RNA methyltransferase [Bacillota bacterium]